MVAFNLTAIWTLHNDVIDYVFFYVAKLHMLDRYTPQIGYFTFWLSIGTLLLTYYLCLRKESVSIKDSAIIVLTQFPLS